MEGVMMSSTFSLRLSRTTKPRSFFDAVISTVAAALGLVMFGKTVWNIERVQRWGMVLVVVLSAAILYQLFRIHRLYKLARPAAEHDERLRRSLLEVMRGYYLAAVILLVMGFFFSVYF